MSNQDNVFEANQTSSATTQDADTSSNTAFEEWVGEGKKYSSVEDLAKSAMYSQDHIKSLERERDQLREDVDKNNSLDSILDRISSQQETSTTQETPSEKSQLKSEDITSLINDQVQSLFEKQQLQSLADSNKGKVNDSLMQKYGSKASDVLEAKAKEVGLSVEQIGKIAETSPEAVLAYFANTPVPQSVPRMEGSFNTETSDGVSNNVKTGTSAYYSKLRKDDPKLYYSNKIQFEMVNKAKELGDSFYQ